MKASTTWYDLVFCAGVYVDPVLYYHLEGKRRRYTLGTYPQRALHSVYSGLPPSLRPLSQIIRNLPIDLQIRFLYLDSYGTLGPLARFHRLTFLYLSLLPLEYTVGFQKF